MRALTFPVCIMIVVLSLSGCASLEPDPCTGEWVKWRTQTITGDFRQAYDEEIRDLARFSRKLENPSPLILLEMGSKVNEFHVMAEDFAQSVMPELSSALEKCGTPIRFVSAFSDLLETQGIDRTVLDWVDAAAIMIERNLPSSELR